MSSFYIYFALILALAWGIALALALQRIEFLRWMADKRTWILVVIGVAVDLALAWLIVPFEWWWRVAAIIGASSVGLIGRSIYLERAEWTELMRTIREEGWIGEQRQRSGIGEDREEDAGL